MNDFINWFTKFYQQFGLKGLVFLMLCVLSGYILKKLIDIALLKVKAKVIVPRPKRWTEKLTNNGHDEDDLIEDAKESFETRMDTCIADSISRLRPSCALKGAVFGHMLRLRMLENKRMGLELLNNHNKFRNKATTYLTEIVVAGLHSTFNNFEKQCTEDGIPHEIVTKFMQINRATEDVISAVAKRLCLVELFDNNTKKIIAVVEVIATLTVMNVADYQETSEAFNGKAKLILKEAFKSLDLSNGRELPPMYAKAKTLGCLFMSNMDCNTCEAADDE